MNETPHMIALRQQEATRHERVENDQDYRSLLWAVVLEYEEKFPQRIAAFKGIQPLFFNWECEALHVIDKAVLKRQDVVKALDALAEEATKRVNLHEQGVATAETIRAVNEVILRYNM